MNKEERQKRKRKKAQKKLLKALMLFIVVELLFVLLCIHMSLDIAPITEENSFLVIGKPETIVYDDFSIAPRGEDLIRITLDTKQYILSSNYASVSYETTLALQEEDQLILRVAKHKSLPISPYKIVELKSDSQEWCNWDQFNEYLNQQRVFAYFSLVIIWFLISAFPLFKFVCACFELYFIKRKHK